MEICLVVYLLLGLVLEHHSSHPICPGKGEHTDRLSGYFSGGLKR